MSALTYWMWLSLLANLPRRRANMLLEHFGTPRLIYFAREQDYKDAGITQKAELDALGNKNLDAASRTMRRCEVQGVRIMTRHDSDFPDRLAGIPDPPLLLYIAGRLPVIDSEVTIGVIGTRKSTPYGNRVAEQIAFDLTKSGAIVVSGLAEGIDSAAARGALRGGGRPIGVLGTGTDIVYPRGNDALQEDVAAYGALVSEYPPGSPGLPGHFPERNRIISGLSLGITVVEAPRHSGALITVSQALDQGREIFVVPGNIDAPASGGSNELLKDCAIAITSAEDILREYEERYPDRLRRINAGKTQILEKNEPEGPERTVDIDTPEQPPDIRVQLEELTEEELAVVSVMTRENMHMDDIIELSGQSATRVLAALTSLELKGYAASGAGRRYSLIVSKGK